MKKKGQIIRRARAIRDLEDRSEYIRQRNPRAAIRFLDAAEATFRLLAERPGLGTRYDPDQSALAELRFFPINRFKKDLVFYLLTARGIDVLRVLHGAQDIDRILGEEFGIEADGDGEAAEE